MKDIAIVILNWNGYHHLKHFLPSVQQYSNESRIIVIDNGSEDDSHSFLSSEYPEIEQINLEKNYGFCGGYNLGLEKIDAKYYVILNSDVEVTKDWLHPMYRMMENDNGIAACQPKIKSYHDKNYFEHAGAAGGFIDMLGYPFCRGRIFTSVEKDTGQYDTVSEIFWSSGACMMIRAEVFHALKGFDERFFAHMEEIDLCWRIKNTGKKIYYTPESTVYHLGGGTLHKSNPRKTYLNFRNGLMLIYKNLSFKHLIPVLFIRMLLDGVAFIDFVLVGYPRDAFAILRAHLSFYKRLPSSTSRRKMAQKIAKRSWHKEILMKSIVWQYFILKKKKYTEQQ